MSHVAVSFETTENTRKADELGTLRILDAVRLLGLEKKTRIYQASRSELYGKFKKFLIVKKLHFTLITLMPFQKCILTGLQ
jgi:GDP-D-mannose dehydratase